MLISLEALPESNIVTHESWSCEKFLLRDQLLEGGMAERDFSRLPNPLRMHTKISYHCGAIELCIPDKHLIKLIGEGYEWNITDYLEYHSLEDGETICCSLDGAISEDILSTHDFEYLISAYGNLSTQSVWIYGEFKVISCSGYSDERVKRVLLGDDQAPALLSLSTSEGLIKSSHCDEETPQDFVCIVSSLHTLIIDPVYTHLLGLVPGDEFYIEITNGEIILKPTEVELAYELLVPMGFRVIVDEDGGITIPQCVMRKAQAPASSEYAIKLAPDAIVLEPKFQ